MAVTSDDSLKLSDRLTISRRLGDDLFCFVFALTMMMMSTDRSEIKGQADHLLSTLCL